MATTIKDTILLLGGTGKVSSRIAPLLSTSGYSVILASRSGATQNLPNCHGIKFDWFVETSFSSSFEQYDISTVFIVAPPVLDQLSLSKAFLDTAVKYGVKRVVLLSASVIETGDGPMMGSVAEYLLSLGLEYAILRPTWFMENFSEMQHVHSIRDEDKIVTATGQGRVPFVSVDDIAALAYRALTDEKPHNTDHLVLGPELFSYDQVAEIFTKNLGRTITHVVITEDQSAAALKEYGVPEDYARMLAQLDTHIKQGKEEISNDVVFRVTGKQPRRFEDFVRKGVEMRIWDKVRS